MKNNKENSRVISYNIHQKNDHLSSIIKQSQQQMLSLTEHGEPVAFMMSPELLESYIKERIAMKQTQIISKPKKFRAGALAKYANPALIEQENTAWEQAVVEKYAHH